jgi:alkylated DNA repair protein (DNA oxidative demethylase)
MGAAMTRDLFETFLDANTSHLPIAPGAVLLRGFASAQAQALMASVDQITARAALRHLQTPGGRAMSVAMSNCGSWGWTSDAQGYRYAQQDPLTGNNWPAMPPAWLELAAQAAATAGYPGFEPDACLINQYLPGAQMSLHQDRDEKDFSQPIVSVSLGLPVVFLFGGPKRSDKPQRLRLAHGDVVVWGGPARLAFHGVMPLENGQGGEHPLLGQRRINLTFRRASAHPPPETSPAVPG